jgi:hypothetical protein
LLRVSAEYLVWSRSENVVVTDSPLSYDLRCNGDTVTIVDVTDKTSPEQLSRTGYASVGYTHQGWLTEDHNTFLFGDELDEMNGGRNTRTFVMNVEDLMNPRLVGSHSSEQRAIDHNLYIRGNYVFQANYKAGLQVLEIGDVANSPDLTEIAWFDVYPQSDRAEFNGAWSNYPYFASGNVIVSSIDQGLFVLKVDTNGPPPQSRSCVFEDNVCTSWFGLKTGYYMHRSLFFGLICWRGCVVESQIETRRSSGWQCGSSCS